MGVGWASWADADAEAEAETEAAGESAGVSVAEMSLRGIALRVLFFCGNGFVFQAAVMPELREGSPLIVCLVRLRCPVFRVFVFHSDCR